MKMTKAKRERKFNEARNSPLSELQTMVEQNREIFSDLAKHFRDFNSRLDVIESKIEDMNREKCCVKEGGSNHCDRLQQRIDSISSLMTQYLTSQENSAPPTTSYHVTSPRETNLNKTPCGDIEDVYERILALEQSIRRIDESTKRKHSDDSRIKSARKFKSENTVLWSETMNARKKSYWRYFQNLKKSRLYDNWISECPEYLPLKYRPKINASDCGMLKERKMGQAFLRYKEDITLMECYTERHKIKTETLDNIIRERAEYLGLDGFTITEIALMWEEEAEHNQSISEQLWKKRESFLIRKKEEDMTNVGINYVCQQPHHNSPAKWKTATPENAETCVNWRQNTYN